MTLGHINSLFLFLYNKTTDNYDYQDSDTYLTPADY